jgi:glycosyltransferase involved in cell wall biosynthesis
MVLLFSNERVVKDCSNYFARIINFTDFLVLLSGKSSDYQVALLCDSSNRTGVEASRLTPVEGLTQAVLELPYLENRYQSFLHAFSVARKMRAHLLNAARQGQPMAVAAPGLNSISFVLSFLLPRKTRWYLFIRGDTRKTVDEIYRRSPLRRAMTTVIDLFQWRVNYLLSRNRGHCFVFGEALKHKFYAAYSARTHVVSPLLSSDWLSTPLQREDTDMPAGRVPRVLFVGRLSAEKNIAALIEACAGAKSTRHRFRLTLVGDGPLEPSLRQQVDALELADDIEFTGRVSNGPDLVRIYDSHDIFCLPSATEGTPRAIAESVARGVPVVASDVGSIRHMFDDGVVRLLGGLDADAILEALAEVIDQYPKRHQRAQSVRGDATRHGLDFNVERVHKIIQRDLAGPRGD